MLNCKLLLASLLFMVAIADGSPFPSANANKAQGESATAGEQNMAAAQAPKEWTETDNQDLENPSQGEETQVAADEPAPAQSADTELELNAVVRNEEMEAAAENKKRQAAVAAVAAPDKDPLAQLIAALAPVTEFVLKTVVPFITSLMVKGMKFINEHMKKN